MSVVSLSGAGRLIADRMWRSPEDRVLFEKQTGHKTIPPMHTYAYKVAVFNGEVEDYHHDFLEWSAARIRITSANVE